VTNILQIELILVHLAKDSGNSPVNYEGIELSHLSFHVKCVIFRILIINSAHNHFELIDVLIVYPVLLGAATKKDLATDFGLEVANVPRRKKTEGDLRGRHIPPEHVLYKIWFCDRSVLEARDVERPFGRSGGP